MAFTYSNSLSTDRDKVRFYIQDTVSNAGPKPGDANFSDEEIAGLLAAEGSWQRAVAAAFETLAAAWRRYPSFDADGLRLNRTDIADGYAAQAQVWRKRYGRGGAAAGYRHVTRADGYSNDYDNAER